MSGCLSPQLIAALQYPGKPIFVRFDSVSSIVLKALPQAYWNRAPSKWGGISDWDIFIVKEVPGMNRHTAHATLAAELKLLECELPKSSVAYRQTLTMKSCLKVCNSYLETFYHMIVKTSCGDCRATLSYRTWQATVCRKWGHATVRWATLSHMTNHEVGEVQLYDGLRDQHIFTLTFYQKWGLQQRSGKYQIMGNANERFSGCCKQKQNRLVNHVQLLQDSWDFILNAIQKISATLKVRCLTLDRCSLLKIFGWELRCTQCACS